MHRTKKQIQHSEEHVFNVIVYIWTSCNKEGLAGSSAVLWIQPNFASLCLDVLYFMKDSDS